MHQEHKGAFSSNLSFGSAKDLMKITLGKEKEYNHLEAQDEKPDDSDKSKLPSGWSLLLVLTGASTAIGACVPAGYNIGVLNTPQNLLKQFCNASVIERYDYELSATQMDLLWACIVSIFLVGATIGALAGGWLADYLGRKGSLAVNYVLYLISSVLFAFCGVAQSIEMMLIARFIAGLGAGLTTSTIPMYLTEVAPVDLSGPMGVLCPMGLSLGVVLGQIFGLKYVLGTEEMWPFLLSLYVIPVLLAFAILPFLAESPKYLIIIKGEVSKGVKELSRLRPSNYPSGKEVIDMQTELKERQQSSSGDEWSIVRLITYSPLRIPLLLVCALHGGQQLSGINAVFYYSVSIFESASLSEEEAQLASIGAALANLAMAVLAAPITAHCGRRPLTLISLGSSFVFLVSLAFAIAYIELLSWLPVFCIVAVIGYVISYGLGLGPIAYFLGAELFPQGPRPAAMALGSMTNWLCNFLVGMTFPILQRSMGSWSFLIFATSVALVFLFVAKYLPETKGKNPNDILNKYFLKNVNCELVDVEIDDPLSSPGTESTCGSPVHEDTKKVGENGVPEGQPLLENSFQESDSGSKE